MITLNLTTEEFRFLLTLIENEHEDLEGYLQDMKDKGFSPKRNETLDSLWKKANNTYQEWEVSQL